MFKEIKSSELDKNIFEMIAKEWAIITVQADQKVNAMTASWLQMGHLWNKDVVTVYVRPQRYTNDFIKKEETFSVAFFGEGYRKELAYLGVATGREEDKLEHCQMSTTLWDNVPIIEQAEVVFVCKKLYQGQLNKEKFLDEDVRETCYEKDDFHHAYVAEIVHVLVKV
ncbi:MAG: flavin reductase family protein [Anaerorhabdus sp.]